jgi:hypothetical protein
MFTDDQSSRFASTSGFTDDTAVIEPATANPLDDVFGNDSDEEHPSQTQSSHQSATSRSRNEDVSDVPRLQSIHTTNGYREGIAASKEQFLQEGFDEGYSLGAEVGAAAGRVIGVLEALVAAIRDPEVRAEVFDEITKAKTELSAKGLYAPTYFGEDGIWKYEVNDSEGSEEDVTFRVVAGKHPLIIKWTQVAMELKKKCGLGSITQTAESTRSAETQNQT